MGYWEEIQKDVDKIIPLLESDEITLSIYRLGRIVVKNIYPELMDDFPEFEYTDEQENKLLLLLAKIQSDNSTSSRYQEIQ